MSDTPETDRQWTNWLNKLKNPIESFVDFARKLERERDEAQRQAAELQACLDEIEEYGTEEINVAINLRQQLASALCERDEIAALVRRLFQLLETVEVSDSEREFYPTRIQSCRVMHTIELGELLPKLKEAAK